MAEFDGSKIWEDERRKKELNKPGAMLSGKVERRQRIKLDDYTGYEDLSSQTTITPLNLYEGGASPTLAVEVKRTFGQEVMSSNGEIALTSDEIMSQDLLLQIEEK